MAGLLDDGQVLIHPWVTGELALGSLSNRAGLLELLGQLPMAPVARAEEMPVFIDRNELVSTGIGYLDAHLLAAVHLAAPATLWSRDQRLLRQAVRLGVAYAER